MEVRDVSGERSLVIDGNNDSVPTSVFISGPGGMCVEVNRAAFLSALKVEFGMIEEPDAALRSLLLAA